MKKSFASLIALFALVGCVDRSETRDETPGVDAGDVGSESDLGLDAASDLGDPGDVGVDPFDPGLARTPRQPGVGPDGADDVSVQLDSAARAGRYESPGFSGIWAHCRPRDFKLYNGRIEVCVQNETSNRLEMFTGGMIMDIRQIGDERDDVLDMLKPRVGFNVHFTEKVEVIRDGTDGGPAVIRTTGRDTPVAYLVGIVGDLLRPADLRIETEYRLFPDADEVEIVTWVSNPKEFADAPVLGDWFAPGDRAQRFRGGLGLVRQDGRSFPWIATIADGPNVGYLPDRPTTIDELPFSAANPWLLVNLGNESIDPGGEVAYRRWLSVGNGTLDDVARSIRARTGEVEESVTVRVVDSEGDPQPGLMVEIFDGDTAGVIGVSAPSAEYTFRIEAPLDAAPHEVAATLTDGVEVEIPTRGTLSLTTTEAGAPVTALAKIIGDARGEFFSVAGAGSIDLAPGDYTIVVSRGMEYEVLETDVQIVAGQTEALDIELVRVIETTGWIAADFHQHMEPSSDSDVAVRQRVIDNVAEGVEFVAATDHDIVTDLQPYIDELGLQDELSTMPGSEISPTAAHIGIYPLRHDRNERGDNSVMLATIEEQTVVNKTIPDVIAAARARSTDPIVQLNHPRGGTSLFETVRYDSSMHPDSVDHEDWSTDFDVIEIVNRSSSSCAIMGDWSTFLNTGFRITGLGNSDSHRVIGGDAAGVPRNYLVSNSTPGQISDQEVVDALRTQRVTVGAHAFIRFSDGKLPGDRVATTPDTPVEFGVEVQTPSWSQATRLHVIVNGSIVESLDASPAGTFDFDTTVARNFDRDSWVVFLALGPAPATQADYGGVTLAFTNPVFVDVDADADGDGDDFEPPGLQPIELGALNESGWCD